MNMQTWDPTAYAAALSDSLTLLAEIEGEEWAAALALQAYDEGEIDGPRLRDMVGEAALRAFRVKERLDPVRKAWGEEERTHFGYPPLALRIPFERNLHRIGAVFDRIESFERRANTLAEEEERRMKEALGEGRK